MGSSSTAAAAAAGYDYEVFLSFRGPDTRTGFADHLYHSLKNAVVHVFRDNEELRKGEVIAPNLIEAINKSAISIPIFSQGYASSKWCLNELSHIADRMKSSNHKVMPIFYHISPSDVRHQTGTFGVSFDEHQRSFKEETVVEWKKALKEVGQLKGWHIQKGSSEAEVIEDVLNTVLRQLKKSYVALPNFLVGVEDRVENIKSIISAGSRVEKIIGIHGPGGIGKTTLAKIVYNQLSNDYEGCSFLANVRETSNLKDTGIMRLQTQLISDILKSGVRTIDSVDNGITTIIRTLSTKKVLVCFDDVSNINQLKALMGDSSWFGPGSKIIITTRNKELLNEVGAYSSYEVPEMDSARSLQLFSNLAFRRDSPPPDYMTYSERVVKLTGGLPLALEVIGSLLHGKAKYSWESKLEKLEKVPHKDVQESLMISYEELDDCQKQIFLDVACFFVGFDKITVLYFWDSDLYPREGMEVLEHMSLLKIKEDNIIWMHDQIIDFGRSIITYKNGNVKLENRSRLHVDDEAYSILKKGQTEESVEAMMIHEWKSFYECPLIGEPFASVPSLKLLQVTFFSKRAPVKVIGPEIRECKIKRQKFINLTFLRQLRWLSLHYSRRPVPDPRRQCTNLTVLPQLRWLSLHHHLDPRDMLRINLSGGKLVILDLSRTGVTQEWDGWSQIKAATNLKVLNLSFCYHLKSTPDLSTHGKLERLILSHCTNLTQIHKSIGRLKHLVFLDLANCGSLEKLPEEVGQLDSLVELHLTRSGVTVLEGSLENIKNLEVLRLDECCYLSEIPSKMGGLSYLTTLKISLTKINQVPKLPESLICLHLEFDLRDESKNEVPDLSNLVNLRELDFKLYNHIEAPSLLWWIGRLSKLETLTLTSFDFPRLGAEDDDLGSLSLLKTLCLKRCYKLQNLPTLPSSLVDIYISGCRAIEGKIDVSNLNQLLKFQIYRGPAISEIRGLPSSLVELHLKGCTSLKSIGDISNLKMLSAISVGDCAIIEIQGLDSLENLKNLELFRCKQLLSLPRLPRKLVGLHITECPIKMLDFSDSAELKDLSVAYCSLVEETRGLDSLENLKKLQLYRCKQLMGLPRLPQKLVELDIYECPIKIMEFSDSAELEHLRVGNCPLEETRGLDSLKNLKKLKIYRCELLGLPRLPQKLVELDIYECPIKIMEFSDSAELEHLSVGYCPLEETRGLDSLKNLKKLKIYRCELLGLPRLPRKLVKLDISYCPIKMLDFSDSAELKELTVEGCPLEETRGLDCLVLSRFNGMLCWWKLELLQGKLVECYNRPLQRLEDEGELRRPRMRTRMMRHFTRLCGSCINSKTHVD